jgi:hypothetical protein
MSSLHRRRLSGRLFGGLALLLIGGTAAGAIALTGQPQQREQVRHPAATPAAAPDRILLSPVSLQQAYSGGTIDRPIKSLLNVPGRMSYGDFRWDEKGVPAGRVWLRVDLKAQIISVFRGADEIGTAVILYGADGVPTPTGKFPILAKLKDHRSATYDAPMPYTLRLTADGVSIHASNVRWGYATHGCIGVPERFAAKLFAAASVGDEVMITRAS